MKQLKPLSHSQLTTSELQFFALNTMGIISTFTGSSDVLKRHYDYLDKSTGNIEDLTGLSRKNEHSPDIRESNELQDSILIGIRETSKGKVATGFLDAKAAEAGQTVLDIMDEFGRELIYGTQEEQSLKIPSFLDKMNTPENREVAESATIVPMLEALATAHEQFLQAIGKKLNSMAPSSTTVKEEKKMIRYRVEGLLAYLDFQIHDDIRPYTELKEPMNKLITDVMGSLRSRKTREVNSKE